MRQEDREYLGALVKSIANGATLAALNGLRSVFTEADTRMLRDVASWGGDSTDDSPWCDELRELADRIEILIPPEKP